LSNTNNNYTNNLERTTIYRKGGNSERAIGYLDADGIIYKLRWDEGIRVGHVTPDRRILRDTRYDERELGSFSAEGTVHSHGLFEGGELGWVDTDGTVVQAGMIFGEEEIGRVEGPAPIAAGAALLLLFFVDEQEEIRRTNR
jgi:YD repeat-containing protein